jgi:TetR/AcrR family transcriptional regulator
MKTRARTAHPGRRSREHSAQTRAGILTAAESVFAQNGFAGARTEAIAERSGVTKAMLYYYFRSKEAIYEAVVEEQFGEFNRKAIELLAGPGAPADLLLRYVELHFDWITTRHRHAQLYHQLMTSGDRLVKRLVSRHFSERATALGALLKRGMENGVFRKADVFHTSLTIVGMIVFYFSAAPVLELMGWADAYTDENLRRRKEEVFDFIRHGLFTNPEMNLS